MKNRMFYRFALTALSLCLCSGCSEKATVILDPYSELLSIEAEVDYQNMFRENGIADTICVIEDTAAFDPNYITGRAGVCFNITTQETIYCKNPYEQLPMASLTKMMTALVALKYGNTDQTVTLGDEVVITTYDAWLCGFQPGDQVSFDDLLKATLVYSVNDAANAVAVAVAGSLDEFVSMMNAEAALIGATDTQFKNPNGLDAGGHYSTAYDLYLIFNECLKYPEFREIIPMTSVVCNYTTAAGENAVKTFHTGNGYLAKTAVPPEGIQVHGGKTGYTANALDCLATLATDQNGDEYIAIMLGAESKQQVYAQTNQFLEKIP